MSSPLPVEEHCEEGHAPDPDEIDVIDGGALVAFRRIVGEMPELRHGAGITGLLALAIAAGRVTVPVLLQQVLDRGILGPDGYRPTFIAVAVAVAVVAILVFWALERIGLARLTRAAESGLAGVRVRTFDHIHRLSAADHTESRRGVLVSRVTSDVETLAQFWSWGAMVWLGATATILGVGAVMAVYSWRLTLLAFGVFVPVAVLLRQLQKVQLRRWDVVRDRVGDTLGEFSEAIGGAPVIRAYGLGDRGRRRLRGAVQRQYRAELGAARMFAIMFPLSDIFGAIAVAAVAGVGVWRGPAWGLDAGELVAFTFLVTLLTQPIADLGEVLDQTQNAAAGARKVLGTLDIPLDVVEPEPGRPLPDGALGVRTTGVDFAYRALDGGDGPLVLEDVSLEIAAGSSVAVVGQTGSGKTTFASLLARLADPVTGTIEVGGLDLRQVTFDSRLLRIRMVPQDGFLFAATVRENIRLGRLDATDAEIEAAIEELGLGWWVDRLPRGLDTEAGERGDNLSVGERQLVALVRAQVSDPGLLILDEATSAVDPETERALAVALTRMAAGRTTVTVAHRLSTAERADRVLVFDKGRLVEQGAHDDLVVADGVYAALHRSWVGGTRTTTPS
ncbi:MAG TPA: ABC transporter ATP-binding protein [Iamia sp.]|nr:ABC transporter ATP-binding protein [Iamia sp.]